MLASNNLTGPRWYCGLLPMHDIHIWNILSACNTSCAIIHPSQFAASLSAARLFCLYTGFVPTAFLIQSLQRWSGPVHTNQPRYGRQLKPTIPEVAKSRSTIGICRKHHNGAQTGGVPPNSTGSCSFNDAHFHDHRWETESFSSFYGRSNLPNSNLPNAKTIIPHCSSSHRRNLRAWRTPTARRACTVPSIVPSTFRGWMFASAAGWYSLTVLSWPWTL